VFAARDSRGWETTQAASLSVIPYIPVTAIIEAERGAQGSNYLTVTIKGYYYNGSFGEEINTLTVQYKADSGAWQTVTPTISGNAYTATINLSLDYQTAHGLHFRIADKLTTLTPSQNIPRAVPQTMEGEGWIRHNVPVYQVCPWYNSDTDNDESNLEAWLDGLLADMPNISTVDIAWNCYPATNGSTVFGKLSKYRDGYAVVYGASYDVRFYLKHQNNGTWSATKKVVAQA
jgi:hypothetical protein